MTAAQLTELNEGQKLIYTRTNIGRAFHGFDDSEITGIYLRDDDCCVVRRDGSQQTYNRELIRKSYLLHVGRLKNFFAYLGPNYRGPSIWRNNSYILFKGWNYVHALGHTTSNAKLQSHWADKFIHLSDQHKLTTLLQSDQTDLGHLVAPDGLRSPDRPIDLDSELVENESTLPSCEPWCSCGSFQRQLHSLPLLKQEAEGIMPWCIHLSWFIKYRQLLCKRTEVRNAAPSGTPDRCVAWFYAPPADATSNGKFVLLHTKHGAQAPLTHWRTYKKDEVFTQDDAWTLFDSMLDAGYVPYPGTSLPQLKTALKKQ